MAIADPIYLRAPVDQYTLTEADMLRFQEEHDLGMVLPTATLLNRPTVDVAIHAISSVLIQSIVDRLYATANGQRANPDDNGPKRRLVGLAAPQIGEPYSIILVDTRVGIDRKSIGNLDCFINPRIVWQSDTIAEGREGCFSAGPVWGVVNRPVELKIEAFDRHGNAAVHTFKDFTARVTHHEIDHLHGMRFPDRITSDVKRHWVHTEELPDYPDHMHEWPRICTLARWEAFKRGDTL